MTYSRASVGFSLRNRCRLSLLLRIFGQVQAKQLVSCTIGVHWFFENTSTNMVIYASLHLCFHFSHMLILFYVCHAKFHRSLWIPAGSALGHTAYAPVSQQAPVDVSTSGGQVIQARGGFPAPGPSPKPVDHFPGTGHTMGGRGSSSQNTWMPASVMAGSTNSSSNAPSREDIAARRLAALSANNSSSTAENV